MAQQGVQLDRDIISCSICLDLLKDPVALNCGHNYCMDCIKTHWDTQRERHIYSCPQCRKVFVQRPELVINTMLSELVETLKKTGLQAAPADHCYAGPEDVACDFCTGRKLKALKSCLFCMASYCEKHLQPHYESPTFKKHKLVEPSKKLQENLCSRHDEVMKIFCRTDQQCICILCSMDEHKGHDTVSAAAERTERQKELEGSRLNIQQRITDVEKDVKVLQQEVEAINGSADKAVEHSEKTFAELIRLIQKTSSDVKHQVRSKQQAEVSRVRDLQEKLEQEIAELKRKDAELKTLSLTEDHNQFLHDYRSLPAPSESTHSSSINIRPLRYFEDMTAAVSEAREMLQDVLRETGTNISRLPRNPTDTKRNVSRLSTGRQNPSSTHTSVINMLESQYRDAQVPTVDSSSGAERRHSRPRQRGRYKPQDVLRETGTNISLIETQLDVSLPQPEPKTRADFLRYSRELTLDPNTANTYLLLSEGNRKATYRSREQSYPSHTDRFTTRCQVLSTESMTGCCYWEVEWRGGEVCVAVAYKNISRAGYESGFGRNDKSWALMYNTNGYAFVYNRVSTPVSGPQSSRIGVYLDHSAGVLSFYSVPETKTMTLLHRVQTTFTQPLYAGVAIYGYLQVSTAEFIKIK